MHGRLPCGESVRNRSRMQRSQDEEATHQSSESQTQVCPPKRVKPKPQSGAKLVAAREGVHQVQLRADSTNENYLLRFLAQAFHGVKKADNVPIQDSVVAKESRENNVISSCALEAAQFQSPWNACGLRRSVWSSASVTLMPEGYVPRSSSARIFKPLRVVTLAIKLTMTSWLIDGLPRQF